jgi:hypothetical protein
MSYAYTILGALCAALLFGLAACERQGPAEKAGRSIDRTVEKAGERIEDAAKGRK